MKKVGSQQRIADLEAKVEELQRKADVWQDVATHGKETVFNKIARRLQDKYDKARSAKKEGIKTSMSRLLQSVRDQRKSTE